MVRAMKAHRREIWMTDADWEILKEAALSLGLNPSQLIRLWLIEQPPRRGNKGK